MAVVTPTATSQFLAGIGLWSVGWSAAYKLQTIAKLCRCDRWVNQEKVFAWIRGNKVITLISTEIANLIMHPPDNPSSTTFMLGGTFVNLIMIFLVVPFTGSIGSIRSRIMRMFHLEH